MAVISNVAKVLPGLLSGYGVGFRGRGYSDQDYNCS